MFQRIRNQPEEQMGSWVGWDRGEVAWRSPAAPVSHTLRFQDSVKPRAGVLSPVSISCIRMWDLLIRITCSPHLPGHWVMSERGFFSHLGSTLKLSQSEIFELKVEQLSKMKRPASETPDVIVRLVSRPQAPPGPRNAKTILSQQAAQHKAGWVLFSRTAFSLFTSVAIQMGNLGNFMRDRQTHSNRLTSPNGPRSGRSWDMCKGLLRAVMCKLCLFLLHLWN